MRGSKSNNRRQYISRKDFWKEKKSKKEKVKEILKWYSRFQSSDTILEDQLKKVVWILRLNKISDQDCLILMANDINETFINV